MSLFLNVFENIFGISGFQIIIAKPVVHQESNHFITKLTILYIVLLFQKINKSA